MAYPGLVIENPLQKDRIEFVKTRATTNGDCVETIVTVEPGGAIAEEHIHPLQEDRFEVLEGTVRATVFGEERVLGPGDSLVVPPGAPHRWWNGGDEGCAVRAVVRPALDFEEFVEMVYGLARDGRLSEKGGPKSLLQIAPPLSGRFRNHFYLASPPVRLQRLLFAILTPIGRLRGYRSEYPEYVQHQPEPPAHSSESPSRS